MNPIMFPPAPRAGRAYSVDTAYQTKRQQYGRAPWEQNGQSKFVTIEENAPVVHRAPELLNADDVTLEKDLLGRYDCQNEDYSIFEDGNKVATWKERGTKVTIRRVPRTALQAASDLEREINIISTCRDPSIPLLVESLELKNVIWAVKEYRSLQTVGDLVKLNGPMTDIILKSALNQLFSGIAALFMGGFAHLRITDQTICFDSEQQIVITDFYCATEYKNGKDGDIYAATQEKFGDDIYVAPEIFSNITFNARKATIWSCGILLYYMVTAQTEKLSNLDHPSFETTSASQPNTSGPSRPTHRRLSSATGTIVHYPGSARFEIPNYARWIIPKMLATDPLRRAELIEICSRVPKDYSVKDTRPLMELAWLDYKTHVGPYQGWDLPEISNWRAEWSEAAESSASSIYSLASAMSNPFRSLLGRGDRRKSTPVAAGSGGGRWA